jgi:large subunit ribosomal protein L13
MSDFKTFSEKTADVTRRWVVIDATDAPLGRVAGAIAKYLIGKYKPTYTPHIDGGDYVIVVNAEKVAVTGNKEEGKIYATLKEVRTKHPERIIADAVKGMLPKNKLSVGRMERLKIFVGPEHAHAAQKPEKVEVK